MEASTAHKVVLKDGKATCPCCSTIFEVVANKEIGARVGDEIKVASKAFLEMFEFFTDLDFGVLVNSTPRLIDVGVPQTYSYKKEYAYTKEQLRMGLYNYRKRHGRIDQVKPQPFSFKISVLVRKKILSMTRMAKVWYVIDTEKCKVVLQDPEHKFE